MAGAVTIDKDVVMVITDSQWRDINASGAVSIHKDVYVVTVPDSTTFEQRHQMIRDLIELRKLMRNT